MTLRVLFVQFKNRSTGILPVCTSRFPLAGAAGRTLSDGETLPKPELLMNSQRLLRQFALAVSVGVILALIGFFPLRNLLVPSFDTLKVERDLRAKLEADGLLARIVATSKNTLSDGKLDNHVIEDLHKREWRFTFPQRTHFDEWDCVEFWFGGADQHWGLMVTRPGTKPRPWAYLHQWDKDVWFFSEIPPR